MGGLIALQLRSKSSCGQKKINTLWLHQRESYNPDVYQDDF
jgi:hypothetical protein